MEASEVGAYWLLLLTAWEQERHGYLPDDQDKLRRWSRLTREQWSQSSELILSRFPVVEDGWRANPRMVAEAEKARVFAEKQIENGKKGGRPKKTQAFSRLTQTLLHTNPTLRKKQSQKKLAVAVAVAVTKRKKDTPQSGDACVDFQADWNEHCGTLAKVVVLDDSRKTKVRSRTGDGLTVERFTEAVKLCASTPFLRGEGERGFRASFDWLTKNQTNLTKVLEGQYASAQPANEPKRRYREEDFSATDTD